jgi:hypothetical protein
LFDGSKGLDRITGLQDFAGDRSGRETEDCYALVAGMRFSPFEVERMFEVPEVAVQRGKRLAHRPNIPVPLRYLVGVLENGVLCAGFAASSEGRFCSTNVGGIG